jgi:hypothetical protein
LTIEAGGFLLFYANSSEPDVQRPRHTNFALSADGEFLGLYGALGAVRIDGIEFGPQLPNFSTGRYPDGNDTWAASPCVTPGAANTPCAAQLYVPLAFTQ